MDSIKSKRGSYIAEAAIVLPMIVLAVITTVLIIMFFYSGMTEQSKMHMVMRRDAGIMVEKSISSTEVECDADYSASKIVAGQKVSGKKEISMIHKGILKKKGSDTLEGHSYGVDGVQYIRYCRFVKDTGNEDSKKQ